MRIKIKIIDMGFELPQVSIPGVNYVSVKRLRL